jgi:shikimate kinase
MGKYLIVTYGLPGVGKSTFASGVIAACTELGYPCQSFNPGRERRENGFYSHIRDAEDFRVNRAALDEISGISLDKCIGYLSGNPEGRVAVLDQTSTRRESRERLWKGLKTIPFVEASIVEMCIKEGNEFQFIDLNGIRMRPDYASKSNEEIERDFKARLAVYKEWATHYDEDNDPQVKKLGRIKINRSEGLIDATQPPSPELTQIILAAAQKIIPSVQIIS